MASPTLKEIPVVDVGSLWSPNPDHALERVAAEVHQACRSAGFFYIANHGVPQAVVDDAFEANRRFHARPLAEKLALKLNRWHRGYQAFATSKLVSSARFAPAQHPNQLESFFVRHEVDPADPAYMVEALQGPNQWPDDDWFREVVVRYDSAVRDVGLRLLRVFSVAAGEQPDFFGRRFEPPSSALRLIHYPPAPSDRPDDLYGSHPHTDYGFLTVLAQDDVGGLQVRNTDGSWLSAPYMPGTFVVNIGDALARWTNDAFNSTPHRVINASANRDRYSIGYFFDPSLGTEISCLQRFVTDGGAKYPPIRYADYFNGRLDANYTDRVGVPAVAPQAEGAPPAH
ncbi:isopenicillin N synthase family dioxygenase [Vineibacter terrae]|uniref:isopenicillin N synthase family dioxygenase n=1 Tax=Vineibacter terrae TaxID=2586908 RepID=UPI002E2FDC14|nr:2-oxoglutarate and iron-dependent oxygenase domain-containing protein [Vineibacter terrae]HEX2887077.1 2-oxoglutarate and iron-dependent oxygenase domain-containing protein [Vineibacter terrae]